MKFIKAIIVYLLVTNSEISASKDAETNFPGDLLQQNNNTVCNKVKCIMKCCPVGKIVSRKKKVICEPYKISRDISNFGNDSSSIFYKQPNLTMFEVKTGIFEANSTLKDTFLNVAGTSFFNIYITKNAELLLEMPNAYDRWIHIPNDLYCWDYTKTRNHTLKPGIWVSYQDQQGGPSRTSDMLMTSAMLISCFFLFIVLVVYGLLPELRNLCGMILMAYVLSLLIAFLLLVVMRMEQYKALICLGLTLCIYFFFLASFCWMNVMSFDIWWTFRGYAKARSNRRRGRGDRFKFLMYFAYAYGLPLIMTIGLGILNQSDMSHIPWFITPKIATTTNACFIKDGEKLLYLYMPMLVLILCNWMFYLMTAFNVWRLSRGTAVLDTAAAGTPQAHRSSHRRFLVYLKLSVVMGLNWVLEVVSYIYPDSSVWFISDFYNIFIGIFIFLIFVCKRNIILKLKNKLYTRCRASQWTPEQTQSSKRTSITDNTTSIETISLHITCQSPKGSNMT